MSAPTEELIDRLVKLVQQLLDPGAGTDAGAGAAAGAGAGAATGGTLPQPFPVDRQLSELGLTSLKMVNLMLSVEMEFDIMIPQTEITPENFQSVGSIARLVARTLPG